MASLVEELVSVLKEEEKFYKLLTEYGDEKRRILVKGDVPALEALTVKEQEASDQLLTLSHKQVSILTDISNVIGRTKEVVTVTQLIQFLENQPEEKKLLTDAKDSLLDAANKMKAINKQNEVLIQQAIELTEFDITLIKSMRQAPQTANYDRNAYNTGSLLGSSGFDAKQ